MISANILKIIAIISMLVDHIGSYFVADINEDIYFVLRSIGRLAMPIFLYLIVQGFFHTKDIKKYIFRIFCLATVTQIIILLLGIVNEVYFKNYTTRVNEYIGVLFSYVLSLIFIAMIEYKELIKRANYYINLILRITVMLLIAIIYFNIDIEFDMRVPFMCIELYVIEKIFMDKETGELIFKRKISKKHQKILMRLLYIALIEIAFVLSLDFSTYHPGYKYAIVFTAIPIALYSGDKGRNNKFIKTVFYAVFPIQHLIFYCVAMFCSM